MRMVEAAERDGRLRPGRHDHRADLGQHRHRPRDRRSAEGLPRDRGHAGQDVAREDRPAARLRRRGRGLRRPTSSPDSPQAYYRVADRLTQEIPGAFQPNQYAQPGQPGDALRRRPGRSCGASRAGSITHFVAGVGTGGTITGIARYLKEQNPKIEVIGADPVGSIYSNEEVHPYLVEGVGEDFWPSTYDPSVVDRYVTVSDRDSFLTTRRLAETEGLLVGGSCGLAMHAALEVARRHRRSRGDGRRDPARRRPRLPLEDLQRRVDDPVRLPGARRRPHRRRRAARMKTRAGEIPPFVVVQTAPARARRDHAAARAPRLAAAGGLRGRSVHGRRLGRRARAAEGAR